jgi:RNA processing factor Prp31
MSVKEATKSLSSVINNANKAIKEAQKSIETELNPEQLKNYKEFSSKYFELFNNKRYEEAQFLKEKYLKNNG